MSKTCISCGAAMEDEEIFCAECGTRQPENRPATQPAQQYEQPGDGVEENEHLNFFVDSDEKLVGYLGRGFLQHYLMSGTLGKGFAAISDKRFYVKGRTYHSTSDGRYIKNTESKIVDLTDVTGTGIITYEDVIARVLGIIFTVFPFIVSGICFYIDKYLALIGVPIAIVFLPMGIILLVKSMTKMLLKVDFAGSSIAFDAKWYSKNECDEFQRKIRTAKDNAVREAEERSARAISQAMQNAMPASAPASSQASAADELMKYAEMREKGLITDEEFAQFKAKLLK